MESFLPILLVAAAMVSMSSCSLLLVWMSSCSLLLVPVASCSLVLVPVASGSPTVGLSEMWRSA